MISNGTRKKNGFLLALVFFLFGVFEKFQTDEFDDYIIPARPYDRPDLHRKGNVSGVRTSYLYKARYGLAASASLLEIHIRNFS